MFCYLNILVRTGAHYHVYLNTYYTLILTDALRPIEFFIFQKIKTTHHISKCMASKHVSPLFPPLELHGTAFGETYVGIDAMHFEIS